MLQVLPDWYEHGTKAILEAEIGNGFTLDGPGFYLRSDQTVLVLRHDPDHDHVWSQTSHDPNPTYMILVWNSPYDQVIFSQISTAPVRHDERGT